MGWDEEDCIKYFYTHDFKDKLPGVDYEDEGAPFYKELTASQREIVEEAYWKEQERQESIFNPEYYYGTSR